MHKRLLSTGLALGLCLGATLMSAGAAAAAISGKINLICAATNAVGCTGGICREGQAATFDMPNFMFVDAKRKLVHAINEKGEEVSSPIKSYEVTDNAIILQGFENHRGWTLGIVRGDGAMSMSSIGADVNFMIFGNCTER